MTTVASMVFNMLLVAKHFMKNQFKNHIVKDNDNCGIHGCQYALSRNFPKRSNTDDNGYQFPFFCYSYLQDLITYNDSIEMDREYVYAIRVIGGISNKFKLFLGHQVGFSVGFLEVGFQAIIKQLPVIKEIVLLSDNATSYQNDYIAIMIGSFNQKFYGELFISSIVHYEELQR